VVYDVRLRAYEPDGDALGFLPEPSKLDVSFVNNDAGALTLDYSDLAEGGALLERGLEQGLEVGVEVTGRDGWVEPRGGRFVLIARNSDQADKTSTRKLTLPSYGWLLTKARNLDTEHLLPEDSDQAGKRPFYSASAGVILGTLLEENAARGGVPVGRTWSSTTDSAGAAWALLATLYYELGIELSTVLDNLAAQGMVDWRTLGRDLALYNPDTVCAPDVADTVRLWLGVDVADAPSAESIEEVVSRVLIRGDAGLVLTEDNPSAPTPWGAWEGYISQGGVVDEGTARQLVQAELERTARVRGQYTRSLILAGEPSHLPMVDYGPGSWITAPTTGTGERVRVQQVTLTKEAGGVSGSVVLNDRVLDAELRRARRVQGITGGAVNGGTGGRPAPEGPDRRAPAAPLGLVVDTDAYIDADGAARGLLTATWAAVTTATDGTLLEVSGYDVAVRDNVVGAPWVIVRSTDGATATVDPVEVGAQLAVKVRARGRYSTTPGEWSDAVAVTVADDTTAPPTPSKPILTTKLGTVTVAWDGLTSTGGSMPRDFDRVDVYQDDAVIGQLRLTAGLTQLPLVGLPVVPHDFHLVALDRSGNASGPSATSTITPQRIAGPDLEANSVTANEIQAGSIDTEALAADAIDGMTITGAVIRTAATGDRVELSGSMLRSIAGGVDKVVLSPQGVTVEPTGSLRSLNEDGSVAAAFGPQYADATGALSAHGLLVQSNNADANKDIFRAKRELSNGDLGVYIGQADAGGNIDTFRAWSDVIRFDTADFDLVSTGRIDMTAPTWWATSGGEAVLDAGGSSTLFLRSLGGHVQLRAGGNVVFMTDSLVRWRLNQSGRMTIVSQFSTSKTAYLIHGSQDEGIMIGASSRRYKQDFADHVVDPRAVLAMREVSWRDRREVADDPTTPARYVGYVAEDLHDAGLSDFVIYDELGRPDGISYDRLGSVGMHAVVVWQQRQLDWLLEHVEALTGAPAPTWDGQATPLPVVPTEGRLLEQPPEIITEPEEIPNDPAE